MRGFSLLAQLPLYLLMMTILAERSDDHVFVEETRAHRRKNTFALAAYFAALLAAAFSPLAAIAILVAVALSYLTPTLMARPRRPRRRQ
jgi:hypothetical protein